MKSHLASLVVLGAIASYVHASALIDPRSPLRQLLRRQTTDPIDGVPESCQERCATFYGALDTCKDFGCLCSSSTAVGLSTCLNCIYQILPSPGTLSSAQAVIDEYDNICAAFDYPPIVVTTDVLGATGGGGGSSSRSSGSSASVPATASGSGGISFSPRPTGSGVGGDLDPPESRTDQTTRTEFLPSTTRSQIIILPSDLDGADGSGGGGGTDGDGALSASSRLSWLGLGLALVVPVLGL